MTFLPIPPGPRPRAGRLPSPGYRTLAPQQSKTKTGNCRTHTGRSIRRAFARGVQCFTAPGLGVFGARVAIQPQTTNAIRTATKIPNSRLSAMLFSAARVGWHQVLRSNPDSLAIFAAICRASSRGAVWPLSRTNLRFHESVTSHQKTKTPIITNAPRTISSIFLTRNIELICERGNFTRRPRREADSRRGRGDFAVMRVESLSDEANSSAK
jgi:hypothetical protein